MTAVSTPQPARNKCFDAQGNHLQAHGKPVPTSYMSTIRKHGAAPLMQVHSRLAAKRGTPPDVVLYISDLPFVLDWRLSAHHARELAANLLKAADMCDQLGRL